MKKIWRYFMISLLVALALNSPFIVDFFFPHISDRTLYIVELDCYLYIPRGNLKKAKYYYSENEAMQPLQWTGPHSAIIHDIPVELKAVTPHTVDGYISNSRLTLLEIDD